MHDLPRAIPNCPGRSLLHAKQILTLPPRLALTGNYNGRSRLHVFAGILDALVHVGRVLVRREIQDGRALALVELQNLLVHAVHVPDDGVWDMRLGSGRVCSARANQTWELAVQPVGAAVCADPQ